MQLQFIWISCDYCNSSYKTTDCGNLPSPWPNYSPFLEELDRLLSSFMEDGTPILIFWWFQHSSRKALCYRLSFNLKCLTTTSTQKSGNQLDLIYKRDCTADNILVQPQHFSDHFFIKFTLHFATRVPPTPLPVTFWRNLRSLSPSHLSSVVSSSLPSPTHFSSLYVNAATDTLCSSLTSCLDNICPLSSRPAWTAPSNPWLSDVLREHRTRLRAAERKWQKSNDPWDLSMYQSLLSSFSAESHWSVFQGGLGRGGFQSTSIGHWGSPGLGSWTPPLLHIHYITGSHHTGTWLLLPYLHWWHTALSLILTRWSNGSCTDLRLLGRHLGMDERTSPTAQAGKNWASCLSCHSNSTAWLHNSVRFINNYPISFGQKSWCNLWWSADLQRAHCEDCSILQVCTSQHQKDQALSDRACCTTSCPGLCHF